MAFIRTTASVVLQQAGAALAFLALAINIYISCSEMWRINDIEGTVLESVRRSSGLFFKCTLTFADKKKACEDYDVFFVSLPSAIIGGRVLTLGGAIFSFIGLLLILVGSSCTTFMAEETDEQSTGFAWIAPGKKHMACIGGGVCMIISSILIGIAVSWFAALIVDNYTAAGVNMLTGGGNDITGIRMVFGPAIWFGWGSMLLALVSGFMAVCGSMGGDDDEGFMYNEPYQPIKQNGDDNMYV